MKKRIISMVVMLFVLTALLPDVAFAAPNKIIAAMAKSTATATLTSSDAEEEIAVLANDFPKFIFGNAGGYVQPGTQVSDGKFNIVNNTGAEYEVVDCGLYFEVSNTRRVNNTASQASGLNDTVVAAMSAADWWNFCNTYYTAKFGAGWTTNFNAVREALGHGGGGQGNAVGPETSQEMLGLANWYYPQVIYLTFNQSGADAISSLWSDSQFAAKPPCTLAEYMAGTNTAWVLGCINKTNTVIGNGTTKTFDMAIAFDGARIGNAAMGASYTLNVGLLLKRIDPPISTADITVKSELEGGAAYADTDVVTITLSQGGDVKYTYILNKANGWESTQQVEAGAYTIAETVSGYNHVSFSGANYSGTTNEITVAAGQAQKLLDVNTKTITDAALKVKSELEGGAAYADTDVVTITLSQGGDVKYTYVLNKANGWESTQQVEAGAYTIAETVSGYNHVSYSGTGYSGTINEITAVAGQAQTLLDINAKMKAAITVKTELEGGGKYADSDIVVITLSQGGVVKYTYILDKTNGWQSTQTVAAGIYTVAEVLSGYKHISCSGTGYDAATNKITVALGETLTLLDINAKIKPADTQKSVPKTGDDTSLVLPLVLGGGSLVIVAILILLLVRGKKSAGKKGSKPEEAKADETQDVGAAEENAQPLEKKQADKKKK